MPTMTERIARALRGPEGRKLAARAKEIARDPRTRRTLDRLRGRIGRKP